MMNRLSMVQDGRRLLLDRRAGDHAIWYFHARGDEGSRYHVGRGYHTEKKRLLGIGLDGSFNDGRISFEIGLKWLELWTDEFSHVRQGAPRLGDRLGALLHLLHDVVLIDQVIELGSGIQFVETLGVCYPPPLVESRPLPVFLARRSNKPEARHRLGGALVARGPPLNRVQLHGFGNDFLPQSPVIQGKPSRLECIFQGRLNRYILRFGSE